MDPAHSPAYSAFSLGFSSWHQLQNPTGVGVLSNVPNPTPLKMICSDCADATEASPMKSTAAKDPPSMNLVLMSASFLSVVTGCRAPTAPHQGSTRENSMDPCRARAAARSPSPYVPLDHVV